MRSSEYMNLFLDYIGQLPPETKIAVLFEEASFILICYIQILLVSVQII